MDRVTLEVPVEFAEKAIVRTMAEYLLEPTIANCLHVRQAMTRYQTTFIAERTRVALEAEL